MSKIDDAWRVMEAVRLRYLEAGALLDVRVPPERISAAIDAAYPWGRRRGYPYRAWLLARREFCARYCLPRRTSRPPAPGLFEAIQ